MPYQEGDRVHVQLGPNIEEATIRKVTKNRVTIQCSDGQPMEVDISKIVSPPPVQEKLPDAVAAAFAVPPLDRETDEEEASLYVINSEWKGQLEQGDPFFEAAEPYMRHNPDLIFRYLGGPVVKRRGNRGYQPVIDAATGKPVQVSGMQLASIPRHVHEERQRRVAAITDEQDAKMQSKVADQVAEASREAGLGASMLDAFETAKTLRNGLPGSEFQQARK